MACISLRWIAFRKVTSTTCLNIFIRLIIPSSTSLRAKCLQVLKTPAPGSGPTKKIEAVKVSNEDMRSTMAATGSRNQRRLANLRTETSHIIADNKDEQDIIDEERKMSSHYDWSCEKERLTSLVEMSKNIPGISESEKAGYVNDLFEFLKLPRHQVSSNKRVKLNNDNTANANSYLTPASAVATSSSSFTPQVESANSEEEYSTINPLMSSAQDQTYTEDFDYDVDYGEDYAAI